MGGEVVFHFFGGGCGCGCCYTTGLRDALQVHAAMYAQSSGRWLPWYSMDERVGKGAAPHYPQYFEFGVYEAKRDDYNSEHLLTIALLES